MNFGYGTSEVSFGGKLSAKEIESNKQFRANMAEKAKLEKITKLTNDIKDLNEKLGNEEFIVSLTPENAKALILLRIAFMKEKTKLLSK